MHRSTQYWHTKGAYVLYHADSNGGLVDDPCHLATLDIQHPYSPGLDISNVQVANEIVGRIQQWAGRYGTGYAPYGALSIDTVYPVNYSGAQFVCQTVAPCGPCDPVHNWDGADGGCTHLGWARAQIFDGGPTLNGDERFDPVSCASDGGHCDPVWTQMVLNWLSRLRDEAHKLNLNLVVNVGYFGGKPPNAGPYAYIPPNDTSLGTLFAIVDGVFDEGGFTQFEDVPHREAYPCAATWMVNDSALACNNVACDGAACDKWSYYGSAPGAPSFPDGGYMRAVERLGKPYFNGNSSADMASNPSDGGAPFMWSLASHLLARDLVPREAFYAGILSGGSDPAGYISPLNSYSSPIYYALASFGPSDAGPGIGVPCEDVQSPSSNVYTRKFSGGWVVVNANGSDGGTANLALPNPPTNGGWPGGMSRLSVPPMTGVVELLTGGTLCCSPNICPNGCCGFHSCYSGSDQNDLVCGSGGARCSACPQGTSCVDGVCQ
jgi:hypothetical protein